MRARRVVVVLAAVGTLIGVIGSMVAAIWLHDLRWLVVGILLCISFIPVAAGS
jgi:hypothetical protein